jgi:phage terminase large subunit-like protein
VPVRKLPPKRADAMLELSELILAMSPDELENFATQLPREDAQLLSRVMAEHHAAGWRADPAVMAAHLDPHFRLRALDRFLGKLWVRLTDGTGRRIILNQPGRTGKTRGVQNGFTWLIDKRPPSLSIYVTYGQQLADETGVAVRDMLLAHSGELRATLRQDRRERKLFRTTEGGGLLVAGFGSTIRGYGVGHGGVLVVDDPYKDWAQAHSEAQRRYVVEQYRGTLRDRLDDEKCGILVTHHRVHEQDLTDWLKKSMEDETGEEWELVILPMTARVGDPLGREVGELLDPEQFPAEAVATRRKALGSYLASALLEQDPRAEEGTEIKRAWFHIADAGEMPATYDQGLSSWDFKLKDREAGDWVVGQAWGRTGADYWLRGQIRGQYDHAATGNAVALLAVRFPDIQSHVVEAAGSADEVVPELRKPRPDYVVTPEMAGRLGMTEEERVKVQALRRRGMSGLIFHPVTEGSKEVRARTFIVPAAEAGNVHVINASFTPTYLDEMAGFPGGTKDQVDATSQALQRMGVGVASLTAPSRPVAPPAVAPQATAPQPRRAATGALVLPRGRRRR